MGFLPYGRRKHQCRDEPRRHSAGRSIWNHQRHINKTRSIDPALEVECAVISMQTALYVLLAFATAAIGTLGGLGGAILLVPVLVVTGTSAAIAAPLGLVTVAAGSIAAAPRQLFERSVNHRIGITTELVATTAAVAGALVSNAIGDRVLTYALAATALTAAVAGGRRRPTRNPPDPACLPSDVGERVGSLSGAYPVGGGVAPYRVVHLPTGLSLMALAGLVAGLAGAPGGFIKTPATSEVMHVPTKIAAATTTFTVGITASAALIVFALQGRIDTRLGSAVVVGALLGGQAGALLQSRLSPSLVRRVLSVLLVAVAVVLVVQA